MSQTPTTPPSEPDGSPGGFQRKLGLFDATMLIVGTMIGSGIFLTSADIARDVGGAGWLMAIWAIAGIMTILGALAYAELAGMMPQAGGQYVFLREAYSPMWGFLYGWTCFLVIQTGSMAAVAVAFAKFLGVIWPQLGTDSVLYKAEGVNLSLTLPWMAEPFFSMPDFVISAGQLVAVGIIVLLTWVNCRGVQEGKVIQNIFTVAKTAALLALIAIGLTLAADWTIWAANWADPTSGIGDTLAFKRVSQMDTVTWLGSPFELVALMVAGGAMVGALFSADAWNNVTFTAGEIKKPERNLPLSLVIGCGIVIALYLAANTAFLATLPINGSNSLAGDARAKLEAIEAAEILEKNAENIVTKEKLAEVKAGHKTRAAEYALDREALLLAATDPQARAEASKLAREAREKLTLAESKEGAEADTLKAEAKTLMKQRTDLLEKSDQDNAAANAKARGIALAKDDRVGTAVVQIVSPTWGTYLMAIAIMISTFGCVNGMVLMGARLYYAMARDGLFFQSVGGLNSRGVPAVGLILQSSWAILLVFSGTYSQLLDYVIFAVLVFYVLTVVGLFVLRFRRPDLPRPTKAFGYPFLPLIYVLLCLFIMVDLLIVKPTYTWPGLIIVLTGIPVYFLWRLFGRKPDGPQESQPGNAA